MNPKGPPTQEEELAEALEKARSLVREFVEIHGDNSKVYLRLTSRLALAKAAEYASSSEAQVVGKPLRQLLGLVDLLTDGGVSEARDEAQTRGVVFLRRVLRARK